MASPSLSRLRHQTGSFRRFHRAGRPPLWRAVLGAALLLGACSREQPPATGGTAPAATAPRGPEATGPQVETVDPEMLAAINHARASIQQFIDALTQPKPTQQDFRVRIGIHDGATVEHLWFAHLDFSANPPTGAVDDQPKLPSLKYRQRLPLEIKYLSDWMYVDHGHLVGGFTTRLLYRRMSPAEQQQFEQAAGYKVD